ncbi:MAG: S8 family serine peptidase, partial [Chloroflexi bacterium]|nr:S8 family serine peptidase [Chloroflexota bacterium]
SEPTATPTPEPTADSEPAPSCGGDSNVIVVKMRPGESIETVNSRYATTLLRHYGGTDIYVLNIPWDSSADSLATKVNRNKKVDWAESGMFGTATDVSSPAYIDGFSLAMTDGFAAAALEGFTSASLDGFTSVALDGFASAALDGFQNAALDGFTQAAIEGFSQAAIEGFTQAAIDYFGQTALEGFSNAALEGFMQAAIDGFTQSAVDGFSMSIADGFTQSAIDGFSLAITDAFTQASLEGFSQAAIDGFALAAIDAFTGAALDSFAEATLAGFTLAAIEGFTLTSLDGFGLAALDAFQATVLAEFGQAGLDQFTQTDLDGFTLSVADGFTSASLDGFTATAIEGFGLAALDGFTGAGLDSIIQSILTQFDALYFSQLLLDILDSNYGAKARQQPALASIDGPLALQHSTGAGTLVAVIDTGITDHWYLRGRIASGGWDYVDGDSDPTDSINGIDDNGNGLVDEGSGHGTHVAGIISLVAPDAKILPIRVQDSDGGGWSFILAEAILYATDRGAHVINVSLEVPCESLVLNWAVNYAQERGVIVVASAGNDNSENIGYPAALPNTVTVAAVDNQGNKAEFSNHGSEITIAAPGVEIYSPYRNGQFAWWSGTSQAAPIVAGEAALIKSRFPWMLSSEIVDMIVTASTDIGVQTPGHGWKRANPNSAVNSDLAAHEFKVNTFTSGSQGFRNQSSRNLAMDGVGNYVVVWEGDGSNGDFSGIFAQRYSANGVSLGAEMQVNSTTGNTQKNPTIGMTENGDFVIAWQSWQQDGSDYGIFAQHYGASGAPIGEEFQVNSYTFWAQDYPAVAMDSDGDFVVTWSSSAQDGSLAGIYAQRYNSDGVSQGAEFQVSTYTTSHQDNSSVAMDAEGNFIVTWQSNGQVGSGYGIYAQRYDLTGTALGGEFRINTISSTGERPQVTVDADGNFIVVWHRDGGGVFARRYTADGAPMGDQFLVDILSYDGLHPTVDTSADGSFVVAWQAAGWDHGTSNGIYAQRYNAAGTPIGAEFLVNIEWQFEQANPSVAMRSDGKFVIVWNGNGPGDDDGVFGRRFE